MPSLTTKPLSKARLWTGRVLSALAVAFLLFSGVIKLTMITPVRESFAQLGYPMSLAITIGTLELVCTIIYAIPRTSIIGAVLLTGYLGGAITTHLRVGDPFFTHTIFPIYIAAMIWGGLYLRDDRLRAILSPRS
jgi:hypothetical protein